MADVKRLLSFIHHEALKSRGNQERGDRRPNFHTGYSAEFYSEVTKPPTSGTHEISIETEIPSTTVISEAPARTSLQQSDLLREFYLTIARRGLNVAYRLHGKKRVVPEKEITTKSVKKRKVVIVGAGMAGLVAAYELLRAGHEVEILEMTQRFGGRVKTLDMKDGFDRGLHVDAGAMRLPGPPGALYDIHYLTDFYIRKFGLESKIVPFNNSDDRAYLKFYNRDPITIEDWEANSKKNFDDLWPGWDETIKDLKPQIQSIGEYYGKTVDVVVKLLRKRLKGVTDGRQQSIQWDLWINNWGQFALDGFLRSKLVAIVPMVHFDDKIQESDLKDLGDLLPWPEAAITAFTVFNYTGDLDRSLVTFLRGRMGEWGSKVMHTVQGGLSEIPKAIVEDEEYGKVESFITYNRTVSEVKYTCNSKEEMKVKVSGVFTSSGEDFVATGDAVILTLPLNIMRQIVIKGSKKNKEKFPMEFQKAIEDVTYSPSTKIMLQYSKRFWDTRKHQIKGGFSRTNLPIGQIHYPTNEESAPAHKDKGILLIYTWKSEALLFGSLPEHVAVREAVNQIDRTIHPGSKNYFEIGRVQAWYSDPASQGAYAHLKPKEYLSTRKLMTDPWKNVYFGGEAISFANGWIQGALESGLRTAYQFYKDNEEGCND